MNKELNFELGYKVNIAFKKVEAGTFVMGNKSLEKGHNGWGHNLKHDVTISHDYYLSQYPVTRTIINYGKKL